MALKYTTVRKFWTFMGLNESTNDYQPSSVTDGAITNLKETVKASPVTAGDYYLTQQGVNEDTLELYAGSTLLTLTTHYTFDSDTSKITITAAGATALSGEDLLAVYEYSALGKHLTYNETVRLLEQAENKVESDTNTVFADQSAASPAYLNVLNDSHAGKGGLDNLYQVQNWPVIKLQTTVNGAYTTGGTEITLADATGFPNSGTIYIGGNKVSFTSKTGNVLTIPSNTPSISDGATVRGEVVEVSTSPSGVDPTWHVLTPDSDYSIDYDTGRIQLMDEYYFQTDTSFEWPQNGVQDRIRFSHQHAWHEPGKDAIVPSEIEEVVYMIAGRQIVQRTVLKSYAGQRDNFNPTSFGFSKIDIDELLRRYRIYHTSNV